MSLYSPPPRPHTSQEDKPTLLVCWWITLFCTTIILLRIAGRFIRSETLFREDKTAALAIIPLLARMGCLHVIFLYGTNNAQLPDDLSDDEVRKRAIGSQLVLVTRILYAATLWILKSAILEFFKRLTATSWKRSHDFTLLFIRCTLVLTFIGVIVSDLAECRPFSHYYQVLPDPGGQCRQGYVQLLTMAACNVITDSMLVIFPVTIILRSHMSVKRKVQLTLLFSLGLGVVGTTAYRVPHIIWQDGSQQIRSLLASVELLFATAAANALVLGSFVRDRGVKKAKFRYGSITGESINESEPMSRRRPTIRHWGSDDDLIRTLGLRAERALRREYDRDWDDTAPQYTPAPLARVPEGMRNWQFPKRRRSVAEMSDEFLLTTGDGHSMSRSTTETTPRKVSFFDVGGLLDEEQRPQHGTQWRESFNSSIDPLSPVSPYSALSPHNMPTPSVPAASSGMRRGSQALLQDIGGLLTPTQSQSPRPSRPSPEVSPRTTELQSISHLRRGPAFAQDYRNQPELKDPGGLLSR
ncbi:hypothetical protein G7054_g9873 [Neopestalotiopsis clavispora]|nr:hypothetical protein G7054_g9873 [Neopestalotiopsis clavispora]